VLLATASVAGAAPNPPPAQAGFDFFSRSPDLLAPFGTLASGLPVPTEEGRKESPKGEKAEAEEESEFRLREDWFYSQRAYPERKIPTGVRQKAQNKAKGLPGPPAVPTGPVPTPQPGAAAPEALTASGPTFQWSEIGPRPMAGTAATQEYYTGYSPWSGRVTAIATHPTLSGTAYIAGAAGGVWKTVDGGVHWTPRFDAQPSLAMASIAIDPQSVDADGETVYAGTGEGNNFGMSAYFGAGIFKSTNGGDNWSKIGGTTFDNCYIADVVVKPDDSNIVMVAAQNYGRYDTSSTCQQGIWRSINGGANWTKETSGNCMPTDLVVDATSTGDSTWYAGFATNPNTWPKLGYAGPPACANGASPGVWRSTDAGDTWGSNIFTAAAAGVVLVDVAPSNGQRLVTAIASGQNGQLLDLRTSIDAGANWVARTSDTSFCRGQCNYDISLRFNPTDPNVFYVGGNALYKYTNGGLNWAKIGEDASTGIHWDQQALAYDKAAPARLWIGHDGGVNRTSNEGASFENLNGDLAIAQFEPGTAGTLDTKFVGGTQDNGFNKYTGNKQWERNTKLGDAGYSAIDPSDQNVLYTTYPAINSTNPQCPPSGEGGGVRIYKTTTNGASGNDYTFVSQPVTCSGDPSHFYAPFVMNPSDASRLYAGTDRVWQGTVGTSTVNWAALSGPVGGHMNGRVTAIGPAPATPGAPTTSDVIYAGTSSNTHMWVTQNGGTNWNDTVANGLPDRFITDIAVDSSSAGTAYATVSGFNTNHVFKTTNFGGNWANISGDLPNTPTNAIAVDERTTPDTLYVGTDVGVFGSIDGGTSWFNANSGGLPNTVVMDLRLDLNTDKLIAVTHGRSAFVTPIPNLNPNRGLGRIAFASNRDGDYDIYLMNANGSGTPVNLTNSWSTADERNPTWSPNGLQLAFQSNTGGDYEIYRMNADGSGGNPVALTTNTVADQRPDWSPDGTKIAWDSNTYIYTMNANGSSPTQITNNANFDDVGPSWSANGSQLAFARKPVGGLTSAYDIYKVNATALATPTQLTSDPTDPKADENPSWSPDGTKIAWDRTTWIHTMNTDGSGRVRITQASADDRDPDWSPEGTRIAFSANRDGDDDLYTMNADGTGQLKITNNTTADIAPAWMPVSYPAPKEASPLGVSLVPNFRQTISPSQCGARGGTASQHGLPLSYDSCNPPGFVPGTVAHMGLQTIGSALLTGIPGDPLTVPDEADVAFSANVTDVHATSRTGSDYNPNPSGADVTLLVKLRISDLRNGPNQTAPGTTADFDFAVPASCATTADPALGSTCSLGSTADAVTPGAIREGDSSVLQLFRVRVNDSGSNNVRGDADDRGFAQQGIYIR
jgi:hypothetical protein